MFSRQKIATVSGLIGGLAVICVGGAAQAYTDGSPGNCRTTEQGDTICVKKSETVRKDKKGTYVIKQTQSCSTTYRPNLVTPEDGWLNKGSSKVGPTVDCSNKTPLPKGFKRPTIKRPHFERPQIDF